MASEPHNGKQSGPTIVVDELHVELAGHAAPASPASPMAPLHFGKQFPARPGFCVVKPAIPPSLNDGGRSASQTKPAAQLELAPVTQNGAHMPLILAPPSPDRPNMTQLHAAGTVALPLSALVQGVPGGFVGGVTVVRQRPWSTWHLFPVGQSASAVQP
jgi:hypothetical protein